jgi:hypothetical protein
MEKTLTKKKTFHAELQQQFDKMSKTGKLFRVELTGDKIWQLYLESFLMQMIPCSRDPNSTTHNCNHCKTSSEEYGNIVAIDKDYNITSIFDFEGDDEYYDTALLLSMMIKSI